MSTSAGLGVPHLPGRHRHLRSVVLAFTCFRACSVELTHLAFSSFCACVRYFHPVWPLLSSQLSCVVVIGRAAQRVPDGEVTVVTNTFNIGKVVFALLSFYLHSQKGGGWGCLLWTQRDKYS